MAAKTKNTVGTILGAAGAGLSAAGGSLATTGGRAPAPPPPPAMDPTPYVIGVGVLIAAVIVWKVL